MSKPKRTPLPWVATKRADGTWHIGSPSVGHTLIDDGRAQLGDGDAELIVRAVNAHDDLLAACKELNAALVVALNVIADNGLTMQFAAACEGKGIQNGVGVRAHAATKRAEG